MHESDCSLFVGCMRMRKLGHGHSVMFFAPLEIDGHIRSLAIKGLLDNIDTMDILHWVICETCEETQQRAPHWAQQGMDHTSRYAVWSGFCEGRVTPKALLDKWLQPEAKHLENLYAPCYTSNPPLPATPAIRQRCEELGILSLPNVGVEEEQERELVHEAEREQQVERPQGLPPVVHSIHQDVVVFVKTGIIPTNSPAFRPAFKSLDATSAASNEAHVWSRSVRVTMDFEKTVDSPEKMDDFLRPVQWFVSGKTARQDPALVVLSPYEVNQLMPDIKSSDNIYLHVYTPRVTRFMKSCDNHALYCIPTAPTGRTAPSRLMDQLNIFAGQLYLKDYETYIRLCHFLYAYGGNQNTRTFQSTPLPSLKTLMGLRRKGIYFTQTHMGKLLDGRQLFEGDFDGCGDVRLIRVLVPFFLIDHNSGELPPKSTTIGTW